MCRSVPTLYLGLSTLPTAAPQTIVWWPTARGRRSGDIFPTRTTSTVVIVQRKSVRLPLQDFTYRSLEVAGSLNAQMLQLVNITRLTAARLTPVRLQRAATRVKASATLVLIVMATSVLWRRVLLRRPVFT